MFGLGTTELLVIMGVILLVFGPKQIPKMMKSLGSGIKEMRSIGKTIEDESSEENK